MSAAENSDTVRSATLSSAAGLQVTILDIGATIQSINLPTPAGRLNCILGYTDLQDYLRDPYYVGSTVGRYANRIRDGRICVAGNSFQLDINEPGTGSCLHGGSDGLHRQRFILNLESQPDTIVCRVDSPAGAQGFPGAVSVEVRYEWLGDFSLSVEYRATTSSETVLGLANHAYFNLDHGVGVVDSHRLRVLADHFTPVDEKKIPTGEWVAVGDSSFDLRESTMLGKKVLDHNFVPAPTSGGIRPVAELYSPASGVGLLLHSTQAGLQVYTGDFLDAPFLPRQGIALEAQNFPDAPNQPGFPSAVLVPGEVYRHQTVYEFRPPVA